MQITYPFENVAAVRKTNPRAILLTYPLLSPQAATTGVSVTYGNGATSFPGVTDRIVDRARAPRGKRGHKAAMLGVIRPFNLQWDVLHNTDGSPAQRSGDEPHGGWNLADPTHRGTAAEIAKIIAYSAKVDGLYRKGFDGIWSDNWIYGAFTADWMYGPRVDTDRNGQPDDLTADRRNWDNGLNDVGRLLRTYLPAKIVGGNGIGNWWTDGYSGTEPDGWLRNANATLFENIESYYANADDFLSRARRWLAYRDPRGQRRYAGATQSALNSDGTKLCIPPDATPNQDVYMLDPGVMKSMRWGLTLSLVAGVYYELYVGCPTRHDTTWWYDEFDGGKGIRHRGYLGLPRTQPVKLANGVWRRDFAKGIVLNNSTGAATTVTLERPYRHLAGTQNPALNDGAEVRTLTIPEHDGVILLR